MEVQKKTSNKPVEAPHEHRILLSMIALFIRELGEQGLPAPLLLDGTGITAGQLNIDRSDRQLVPLSSLLAIFRRAVELSANPQVGLNLGRAANIGHYGALGYAMLSSATDIDAVNLALRYQKIILGTHFTLSMHIEKDAGVIRLNYCDGDDVGERVFVEQLFAGYLRFNQAMLGRPSELIEVRFTHPSPEHTADYESVFDCPVSFEQSHNELLFKTSVLGVVLPNADPVTLEACEAICDELLKVLEESRGFVHEVAHLLGEHWASQPDLRDIAALLGCDERTVRRKLQAEGASFREIKDGVRKQIAICELKNGHKPVSEIARLVGYGEPSNFRRAFIKWTGNPPGFYRQG